MSGFKIKIKEIHFILQRCSPSLSDEKKKNKVLNQLANMYRLGENAKKSLKDELRKRFFSNYQRRYNRLPKNKKSNEEFVLRNSEWLNNFFDFTYNENDCARPSTENIGKFNNYI